MSDTDKSARRTFLKKLGIATAGIFSTPFIFGSRNHFPKTAVLDTAADTSRSQSHSRNDQIQLALIGAGKMGQDNLRVALEHEGVELVADCDLYDSRLNRCMERFGSHIDTTTDYREILDRKDVDAVVVATPDYWHNTRDALNSGKAVYRKKPMVQHIEEGQDIIKASEDNSQPVIIGSTSTSDIVYREARELYKKGEIGKLNLVESHYDRYSAMGAWQYSIPPGASRENVDWNMFLKDLPEIFFDPKRFFRRRNYRDYGTGVAGDLFVHLFSGIHLVTGSKGPERIISTGGLRFWNGGRDVPDMMTGMYGYPETESRPVFNLTLRVNLADGSGGGRVMRFVGSEGEITIARDLVTLKKAKLRDRPGMSIYEFVSEIHKEYREYYDKKYGRELHPTETQADVVTYKAPESNKSWYDHFDNFFRAIRSGTEMIQGARFGLRAATPALASNLSYFWDEIINWDPEAMKLVGNQCCYG